MELINKENLAKVIIAVEGNMEKMGLDHNDKLFVVNTIANRLRTQMQEQKANDMMHNMPLGGLMKRFMKTRDKDED